MKLCGTVLIVGAAVAALIAVVIQCCLSEEQRFDVLSRLLYPLGRVIWKTGLGKRLLFVHVDETNLTIPRPLARDLELMEEIKKWQPGEEELIVATFPKSGSHLMMQMITQIASNASEETADLENIHHYVVTVEMLSKAMVPANDTKCLHLQNYKERAVLRPWLFLTHLDCEHTPIHPAARYIVVARDPADVLVSMQSMVSNVLGRLTFSKEDGVGVLQRAFGGWAEWHLGWWRHRNDDNVLFLFYEDIIEDRDAAIARVMRFMGREVDPEVKARVAARTDIKYMRERSESFEPPHRVKVAPVQAPPTKSVGMIAKGKSGRGTKELSEAVQAQIRSYCRSVLGGVDFPLAKFKSC